MWAAVENDIVGHSHVRWKAQSLFRIAVFSAWLRAHVPRVRFVLRPFLRGLSGEGPNDETGDESAPICYYFYSVFNNRLK